MNKLEQLRKAAGLSLAELAEKSDLLEENIEALESAPGPYSDSAESSSPLGDLRIRWASTLSKLAEVLNTSLDGQLPAVTPDELLNPAGPLPPPFAVPTRPAGLSSERASSSLDGAACPGRSPTQEQTGPDRYNLPGPVIVASLVALLLVFIFQVWRNLRRRTFA